MVNKPEPGTDEVKEGTGSYVGMADGHTIEIIVDGEAAAFQLADELREEVELIEEDTIVTFEYTEEQLDEIAVLLTLVSISTVEDEE